MKKITKLLMAAVLFAGFSSSLFAKSLVVFYSLTGTTKELAGRIANEADCDIFELELKNPYSKNGNTCGEESKNDKANKVQREFKAVPDLTKYDTVFIGTPVWSNDLSNPVENWILQNQKVLSTKTVVPFCTYWSTGNKEVLAGIGNLSTSKNVKEGISQAHGEKADVKAWLKKIGEMR